jgi:hypothetical protein
MSHAYYPKFRLTPPAGALLSYDLTAYQYVVQRTVQDEPLFEQMEMLDRSTQNTRYGWRRSAVINFEFPTPVTDETTLAESIISKALDDEWSVELSMDNGTTYREVVLSGYTRQPLADKNIGVRVETVWTVADILTALPAISTGTTGSW